MIDLIAELAAGNLIPGFSAKKNPDASVSLSIPRNEKALNLVALAQELATQKTLPSGIAINTGPNDAHVEKFFELLREFVDVDYLLSELERQQTQRGNKATLDTLRRAVEHPQIRNTLSKEMVTNPLSPLSASFSTDEKQRLANMADEPR